MMKTKLTRIPLQLKSSTKVPSRKWATSNAPTSEYLHKSILPTFHFQNCLPRLPVPKLDDTLNRYLTSVRAIEGHPNVDAQAIGATTRLIKQFQENEGPKIHEKLVEINSKNSHTSYICQPWFDMYLESRLPLPLNYNPFLTFKRDPVEAHNDQAIRSTNIIVAIMKFHRTLQDKALSPEVFYMKDTAKSPFYQHLVKYLPNALKLRYLPMVLNSAYPLDMSQFGNLLSSTRIPRENRDELTTYPDSKHIVVLRNGHFYKVDTLDSNGNVLEPRVVKASIDEILHDVRRPNEDSIAYLTTTDRNTWSKVRERLQQLHPATLETVDSAIFCLVLEDAPVSIDDPSGVVNMFLHGDGASRWFDKSFSIIMSKNGEAALNFEHAWGDGVAVMRMFNEVFDESTQNPAVSDPTVDPTAESSLTRLQFELDEPLRDAIRNARREYEAVTGRLCVAAGQSDKMHKNYLKNKKVSPDGIMQLAIQAGHHRMYGHPAATYESCSTSAFKHGRTETIRSCTIEAQAAAKAIVQARAVGVNNKLETDAEYRKRVEQLIRDSCKKHGELTKEAAMGQGFDRHLFGLRYTAEKHMGMQTPVLFKDELYQTMNHIVLSTSTLASHAVSMGGFAPVVPDGFGVGYGVRDDSIGCNITSYASRDVSGLVDAITTSFEDIYLALEG